MKTWIAVDIADIMSQNTAKLGLAVSIEASGEELMEQQDKVIPPTPPF